MKESIITISDGLKRGLVPANTPRNTQGLVESYGAMPFNNNLVSVQQFSAIDTSDLEPLSFPYPQFFLLSEVMLVCTPSAIYEYSGGTLTQKLSGLTVGNTWVCLDFKQYVYLSNSKVAVTRNHLSGAWATDTTVPATNAACNFNGQIIIEGSKVV